MVDLAESQRCRPWSRSCLSAMFLAIAYTIQASMVAADAPVCDDSHSHVETINHPLVNAASANSFGPVFGPMSTHVAAASITAPGVQVTHEQSHVGNALLQLSSVRHERVRTRSVEQNRQQHEQHRHFAGIVEQFRHWSSFADGGSLWQFMSQMWSRHVIVLSAVGILCLFVAILKLGIDYQDNLIILQGQTASPWYNSDYLQLQIGLGALVVWITVGMLVFTQVVHFNAPFGDNDRYLSPIEAAYLCTQILTTVGYGDYTPARPEGQFFVASFIVIGVVVIAVVFTELLKVAMRRGEQAVAKAVGFEEAAHDLDDDNEEEETTSDDMSLAESVALHQRFQLVKKRHKNFVAFLLSVGPFLISVALGTLFFSMYPGENKSVWQAFYMSCITLTSVGFGSFTPATKAGELFASVWMLVGVGATANMIVSFGDWFFYSRRSLQAYHVGHQVLNEIEAGMDADDFSGRFVDKCEYLRFELIRCGMCRKEDIDAILARFNEMAPHDNGIHIEDLRSIHEEPRRKKTVRRSATSLNPSVNAGAFFARIWSRQEVTAADAG